MPIVSENQLYDRKIKGEELNPQLIDAIREKIVRDDKEQKRRHMMISGLKQLHREGQISGGYVDAEGQSGWDPNSRDMLALDEKLKNLEHNKDPANAVGSVTTTDADGNVVGKQDINGIGGNANTATAVPQPKKEEPPQKPYVNPDYTGEEYGPPQDNLNTNPIIDAIRKRLGEAGGVMPAPSPTPPNDPTGGKMQIPGKIEPLEKGSSNTNPTLLSPSQMPNESSLKGSILKGLGDGGPKSNPDVIDRTTPFPGDKITGYDPKIKLADNNGGFSEITTLEARNPGQGHVDKGIGKPSDGQYKVINSIASVNSSRGSKNDLGKASMLDPTSKKEAILFNKDKKAAKKEKPKVLPAKPAAKEKPKEVPSKPAETTAPATQQPAATSGSAKILSEIKDGLGQPKPGEARSGERSETSSTSNQENRGVTVINNSPKYKDHYDRIRDSEWIKKMTNMSNAGGLFDGYLRSGGLLGERDSSGSGGTARALLNARDQDIKEFNQFAPENRADITATAPSKGNSQSSTNSAGASVSKSHAPVRNEEPRGRTNTERSYHVKGANGKAALIKFDEVYDDRTKELVEVRTPHQINLDGDIEVGANNSGNSAKIVERLKQLEDSLGDVPGIKITAVGGGYDRGGQHVPKQNISISLKDVPSSFWAKNPDKYKILRDIMDTHSSSANPGQATQ